MNARRPNRVSFLLAATIVLTLGGPAAPARAAEFSVTRTDDTLTCTPADCSLRGAIIAANTAPGPDVIRLPAGTYLLTEFGADGKETAANNAQKGDLDIVAGSSVTIVGDGPDGTIVDGNGVSTGDRVFDVGVGATLQIGGVTIRNGWAGVGFEGGTHGGGIQNHGSLILQNVVIRDNRISEDNARGGGIANRGAPQRASATLTNVTIRDNEALTNQSAGGGIDNAGLLTLQNSTLAGNKARIGGGIDNVGPNAAAALTNVTISDNQAIEGGGLTGNGGGIGHGGIEAPGATLALTHVTLAANSASRGGDNLSAFSGSKSVTLRNTLFADGAQANCSIATDAGYASAGHNLSSDATCNLAAAGDRPGVAVLLGPLADNGGPTQTRALPPGSAAIDACDPAAFEPTDQRGEARPKDGDGNGRAICDIGAYEAPDSGPSADHDTDNHDNDEDNHDDNEDDNDDD